MIAARPSRGLFIPGSVCWSTKRVNEPNAKGGDYANRATNVFSPAFVARARRLSALPEWYAALYDQAGLMVRQNAENWMKCGTEFFDGQRHGSVVFTRDFSDWSSMPDLSKSEAIWWRAIPKKDSIETSCSSDGSSFTALRQGYRVWR